MATLVQKLIYYELGDEPAIDQMQFWACLAMYQRGELTADNIKTQFNLTVEQGGELDTLLATKPADNLSEILRAGWSVRILAALTLGSRGVAGWATCEECSGKLGIPYVEVVEE